MPDTGFEIHSMRSVNDNPSSKDEFQNLENLRPLEVEINEDLYLTTQKNTKR